MMRSLYNIHLSMLDDPFKCDMSPSTIFRVSGIEKNTTTRDIVNCLMNLVDPTMRNSTTTARDPASGSNNSFTPGKVLYELLWVNDETFLVSTRLPDYASFSNSDILKAWLVSADVTAPLIEKTNVMEQETVLNRHAALILNALKKRFTTQDISSFNDYLKQVQGAKEKMKDGEKEPRKGICTGPRGRWGELWQGLRTLIPSFALEDDPKRSNHKRKREEGTEV